MVLAYYPTKKSDPLVLDNIKAALIRPADVRICCTNDTDAKSL